MKNLSKEEKATNYETMCHIRDVQDNIFLLVNLLLGRASDHDRSKLESPELETFTKVTPLLKTLEYGTKEYQDNLDSIKPALDHHYANNRHHPQHHPKGIEDMNLIDLLEMVADWKASTGRNKNGNILKSLEINAERFDIPPKLVSILRNTLELFEQR